MQQDPYNWPFPHRQDLMSLSTIKNQKRDYIYENRSQSTMTIQGIDGAAPKLKPYQYLNKEQFCNRDDDIPGTKSRPLIRSSNRSDNQLMVDDIKGTRPKVNKFSTNRDPVNPLEPVYKIASYEQAEPLQPKFIRDSYNVQDIEGAQPSFMNPKLKKQPVIMEEVEGSHPRQLFLPKDYVDSLQVKDINNDQLHKYIRNTNPIEPIYQHRDEEGKLVQIGFIDGSKTKQLHPITINKFASSILTTQDIVGAQAGSHSQHFLRTNQRKDYRQTNSISDIEGVKAGTLKKGIESKRYTNPLMPAYQMPGNSEIYSMKSKSVFQKNASIQMLTNAQKLDSFLPQI
ncbi:unnamed protein product [Paramecium pentaurelia]|uniref:Uncharacterized protein n=1 Tax=Paramecium pentaurelia TaxID=43138 RepID=A0A8S1TSU5_9CILI|nr:unnamed protein product [Paramecium pentaurelia]